MLEGLFGGPVVVVNDIVVVDGNLDPKEHGIAARARRWREILPLANGDPILTEEAVHLATEYIGNEALSAQTLIHRARIRFKIASRPIPNIK